MIIKDRMAVIFHGIIGGMLDRNGIGPSINVSDCEKLFKYNVLSSYDCDIFLHSWSDAYKDLLINLYNPVDYLIQPQEMFGYTGDMQGYSHPEMGQSFRTLSRYTSLYRAMQLKRQYELDNNFVYRWILVIRYDLVFLTKLDMNKYDDRYFYVCNEPHWKDVFAERHIDDRIFLASSKNMDNYSLIAIELAQNKYKDIVHLTHDITYRKLIEMFNGDTSMIRFGFNRYEDVEIYRMIMDASQNPIGHAYGALETKQRMENLLGMVR